MQLKAVVSQLKTFSQTNTIRHSSISFAGTAVNGILGIIYFFYLASKLSPDNFGRFSVVIGIITVGFSVFNFGLDQSIVKFKTSRQIIANILFLKIFIALFISLTSLLIFGWTSLFGYIGLGIGAQMLFSFATSYEQSHNNFIFWSALYIGTNFLRLILSILSVSTTPLLYLIIYIFMPLLGFKIFALLNYKKLAKPNLDQEVISQLWEFNRHLSFSSILSAASSKLDSFFIAGFQSFSAAGMYSLATQVSNSVSQLSSAFGAVISPKYSSLDTPSKNSQYLKKNLIFSSVLSILLIPTLIIIGYILFTLSGKNFFQSFPLFLLLTLGMATFFFSIPIRESLLYYFGDSKIFSYLSIFNLFASLVTGFVLIRPYGPLAAAGSFFVIQIISVIIIINRYVSQNSRSYRS